MESTTTRATTKLRARIEALNAEDVPPKEIAQRLGCALSTVYKHLDNLHAAPDRRLNPEPRPPRTHPVFHHLVRHLLAESPNRAAAGLPDHLFGPPRADAPADPADDPARTDAEADAPPVDPPPQSPPPDPSAVAQAYQQLTASAHTFLGTEIIVLRGLLRLTLGELADPVSAPAAASASATRRPPSPRASPASPAPTASARPPKTRGWSTTSSASTRRVSAIEWQ